MDAGFKTRRRAAKPFDLVPAALRADFRPDTAETVELWRRHQLDGDAAAFRGLVEHYSYVAWINAVVLKARRPEFYIDPIGDLVSDGHLALVLLVRRFAYRSLSDRFMFLAMAKTHVRGRIRGETLARHWIDKRLATPQNAVAECRADLVKDLGRLPTRRELSVALGCLIDNPALEGEAAAPPPPGLAPRHRAHAGLVNARTNPEPAVDVPALTREAMTLALRGLDARDAKTLRLLLTGHSAREVARSMGLENSGFAQRVNGLLWELRSRADLASSLGVEPTPRPAGGLKSLPRVSSLPPARKVG
jgi:DNA-directed RNA polymerase specialized sigma subunit